MKMNKKSEQTIAIALTIFIFSSIVAFIMFPVSEGRTIILQTPSGTDSCVVDFVLAQNLTDLCDIVIINPQPSQIIEYNGTQWVNINSTTFTDTTFCNNLGTGAIICAGGNVNLRTILGSSDISVTEGANEITIDYNGTIASDDTVCANVGGGFEVFRDGECNFRTLLEGTSIDITQGADTLTLTNTAPEASACNNVGTGNQLCSGGNINIDTLIAGTGITISDTTDDWTFASQCANTGTGEAICESANNINSLISADTNTLTITDTTGDLTFTPTLKKLCQTIASGGESSLTCTFNTSTSIHNIWINIELSTSDASTAFSMRFNGDSGNNYASRRSLNGGADTTASSVSSFTNLYPSGTANLQIFYTFRCIEPDSSFEKSCWGGRTAVTTGNTSPSREEFVGKWTNTANWITDVNIVRTTGTGTLSQYSQISVWGYS